MESRKNPKSCFKFRSTIDIRKKGVEPSTALLVESRLSMVDSGIWQKAKYKHAIAAIGAVRPPFTNCLWQKSRKMPCYSIMVAVL